MQKSQPSEGAAVDHAVVKAPTDRSGRARARSSHRTTSTWKPAFLRNRDPMLPEQFHQRAFPQVSFAGFPPEAQSSSGRHRTNRPSWLAEPVPGFAPAAKAGSAGSAAGFPLVLAQAHSGSPERGETPDPSANWLGPRNDTREVPVLGDRSRFYYHLGHASTIQDSGQAIKLALWDGVPTLHFPASTLPAHSNRLTHRLPEYPEQEQAARKPPVPMGD